MHDQRNTSVTSEFISTQEVAGLFRVTETTVKRWADDGIIPCVKSPGGHRKFRLADVVEFAEKRGYPISGTLEPPLGRAQTERVRFAVHAKNYNSIAQVLFGVAMKGDADAVFRLLLYLAKHNLRLSTLADEILRPPMVKIGELWREGKLRVDQEHRSSEAVTEAMIRLAPELHRKERNGLTAACACLDGERHDIGLRSMAYALEGEGWAVHYFGADTPASDLVQYIHRATPDLLCVSFTTSKPDAALRRRCAAVSKAVRARGGRFMVGGFYAGNFEAEEFHCDHVAASVTDGIAWLREAFGLRPGPARKTESGAKGR